MRSCSVLWVLPALLVACASPSANDVTLSVQVTDATIQVPEGDALSGQFQLRLALGSYASAATQVTPGNFELQTEAGEALAELRDALPDADYPIALNPGESKQVVYKLDGVSVDRSKVCAGPVRIVGSVMDTLKGGTVPLRSGSITPDC